MADAVEDPFHRRTSDFEQAIALSRELCSRSLAVISRLKAARTPKTQTSFANFNRHLQTAGIRAALIYVLGLSDYRFLSIFRFEDGRATSVVHVDRNDLSIAQADEVPDTATYCCFVRDTGGSFVTVDAALDSRVAEHPARDVIPSYCGVPILTPEGGLIGTLCHYDVVPRDAGQLDVQLLLQVCSALEQSGLIPEYPFPPPKAST